MGLRAVDFAQAALVAGFASVLWEELVVRSPSVLNEGAAYRAGFLFVIVVLWKVARSRREAGAATPEEERGAVVPTAPSEENPK